MHRANMEGNFISHSRNNTKLINEMTECFLGKMIEITKFNETIKQYMSR